MKRALPTQDDFESWREHPVTQSVMTAFEIMRERCRQEWIGRSWANDPGVDAVKLLALRQECVIRADTYGALKESTWNDYKAVLDPGSGQEDRRTDRRPSEPTARNPVGQRRRRAADGGSGGG